VRSGRWTDDGKIIGWRRGDYKWDYLIFGFSVQRNFGFVGFSVQENFGLVRFSVQKQVLSKYTSLEEEHDNLVRRIFVPALEKVGTEAYKSKICVHEKQDS
jgi:hypothetical protein